RSSAAKPSSTESPPKAGVSSRPTSSSGHSLPRPCRKCCCRPDMKFGQRLRSRIWRGSVDDEVDAELEFHVEMRAREHAARGMNAGDARDAAIRRFGDINRVNATCRALGRQRDNDMRRTEYVSELTQDVTFACRQLIQNPGFTAVAVLTLALGIGATAAIFSAVYAVVLRPLPFRAPDRIIAVYEF